MKTEKPELVIKKDQMENNSITPDEILAKYGIDSKTLMPLIDLLSEQKQGKNRG
ncbi:MAG TPA: hypothetical protein VIK81_01110 [Patescibacteria group bacterium]